MILSVSRVNVIQNEDLLRTCCELDSIRREERHVNGTIRIIRIYHDDSDKSQDTDFGFTSKCTECDGDVYMPY